MVEHLREPGPLRGLAAHRVGERAQPLDLGVLAARELRPALLVGGAGGAVLRVRAAVLDELALVEVEHAGDGLVEERDVVAHDEERAAVVAQESHQPLLGVDVEVVGRLVEEEQVAAGEQDAGQLDPAALTTRERVDGHVEAVALQPEARGDRPHLRLGRVAAEPLELLLRVGEPAQVALRRVLVDLDVPLLEPLRDDVETLARQHVRHAGRVDAGAVRLRILGQVADPLAAGDDARGRRAPPRQHLEQRRLAGAVAADEAGLVARAQRERAADQGQTAADFDCEIADLEHAPSSHVSRSRAGPK